MKILSRSFLNIPYDIIANFFGFYTSQAKKSLYKLLGKLIAVESIIKHGLEYFLIFNTIIDFRFSLEGTV